MDIGITLFIMLVCLLLEGFFSGSEMAIVSADRMKLRVAAAKGSKGAQLALNMLEKPEWLLSTTLIGTNISVVTNTTMATALMLYLSPLYGQILAILIVAPLIWVFGEIVPKGVYQQRADQITPIAIYALRFFFYLFFPILVVFTFIARLLTKVASGDQERMYTLREQLKTMIDMSTSSDGDVESIEREMMGRMFNFSETTALAIMRPLVDISAIGKNASVRKAVTISEQENHIRLPVFDHRIDNIVGLLHVIDVIGEDREQAITNYIRPIRYAPGSRSIKDLLFDMRRDGDPIAIIVNEFGGAIGFVTLEDIMEKIVGNMQDEYDDPDEHAQHVITSIGKRQYRVSGRVPLEQLKEELGIEMPASNYTTLAGLILDIARDIPLADEVYESMDTRYQVEEASPNQIVSVLITVPKGSAK